MLFRLFEAIARAGCSLSSAPCGCRRKLQGQAHGLRCVCAWLGAQDLELGVKGSERIGDRTFDLRQREGRIVHGVADHELRTLAAEESVDAPHPLVDDHRCQTGIMLSGALWR